jgi:tetratricopeptide (TPR) repeat protein
MSAADSTRFRFKAALVREALRAQISITEQADRHRAIASALEASSPDAFRELAHHFLHASTSDAARALHYSSLAARELMQAGKFEDAARQLDMALELTRAVLSCGRERLIVMLDKVDAFVSLGSLDRALEAATVAAQHARGEGDIDAMIRAAKLLARLPAPTRIAEAHLALMRDALAALGDGDPRAPGVEALLARAQVWSRCPEGRGERANAALASARKLQDAAVRGDVLVDCLYAFADPEFLAERLAIAEELESIGHQHDKRRLLVASAAARVWAYAELGDMREVDAYVSTLEVLAEHAREPTIDWQAKIYRAMQMIVAGQLEAAIRLSTAALELGNSIGLDYAPRAYCAQVGGVWRLQGRLKEAADLVRDSSLRNPAIAGWQAALAGIEAELGRVQHGREVLRRLLDRDLASLYGDPYGLGALAPAADLCAQVGDAAQAKLLYDALLPYADRHGVVAMAVNTHGPLARHLGRLALRMNDVASASLHFERAIEASEEAASPVFTSLSCLGYAEVLVASDRPGALEQAGLLTARSFQLAHEHGMWNVVERAKALASRCAFRYGRSGLAAKRTAQTR